MLLDPTTKRPLWPPLLLAGDAFTCSNYDGCMYSAEMTAARLIETFGLKG
jgi:hypothetical protein